MHTMWIFQQVNQAVTAFYGCGRHNWITVDLVTLPAWLCIVPSHLLVGRLNKAKQVYGLEPHLWGSMCVESKDYATAPSADLRACCSSMACG